MIRNWQIGQFRIHLLHDDPNIMMRKVAREQGWVAAQSLEVVMVSFTSDSTIDMPLLRVGELVLLCAAVVSTGYDNTVKTGV